MANAPTTKHPFQYRRAGFFRRSWYRYRDLPYVMSIGLIVALVIGASVGGYYGIKRYNHSQTVNANSKLWQSFQDAAKKNDELAMKAALGALVEANPNEPLAKQRLQFLESGDADPSDAGMAAVTYQKHLRASPPNWAEADREARKHLASSPKDWLARCVVAQVALIHKNPEEARKQLDQLADPNKEDVGLHPGGLLMAFGLFAETGKDPGPLRQFVALRVVSKIRHIETKAWPYQLRLTILDCYVRAFDPDAQRKQLDGLNLAVASLGDLLESCRADAVAAKDGDSLQRIGNLIGQLNLCLNLLMKDGVIGEDQRAAFGKDLEERSEKTWLSLVEIQPKNPAGYKGVAIAQLRKKNPAGARDTVAEGLKQCGEQPELLSLYSQLLRADNNAKESVRVMAQAAENDPKNLLAWLQLAEAASAAGEIPIAENAVRQATALAPEDPRTLRACIWLAMVKNDPDTAVHLLNRIDPTVRAADSMLASRYVTAMIESGLNARLPEFLKFVEQHANLTNKPAPLAAAVNAVSATSKYEADATKLAVEISSRATERWPNSTEMLIAYSMALYRIAENSAWELTATKNALRALERLRAKAPESQDIAAVIVWTTLKGENNPNRAIIDAAILADAYKKELPLSGWHMQVLGSAYLAADRIPEAIAVLEKARASGYGNPGVLIPLSLAYYKAKKWDDSVKFIRIAQTQKRTIQEQADYVEAVSIIKP